MVTPGDKNLNGRIEQKDLVKWFRKYVRNDTYIITKTITANNF